MALLPLLARASERDLLGNDGSCLGRSQGRGVIVITSSCASMHNATNVDMTSYATSKAATDHLVRLLAAKFHRFYVRVAGINPGCEFLPTCSSHNFNKNESKEGERLPWGSCELTPYSFLVLVVPSKMNPVGEEGNMFSSLFDKVPAKRAGSDEDIAGVVLYLASRAGVSLAVQLVW